jgi:electron transport complex protein RnfA
VISQGSWLLLLGILSSLSMNLILQCGLGISGVAVDREGRNGPPLLRGGILFITVLFLWSVFSWVFSSFSLGFFEYILLFPLSSMVYSGVEFLLYRLFLKKKPEPSLVFCDGLAAAAFFITLNIASGFIEAAALSFGFALGILLAHIILGEIRRRSMMEGVPRFLRGSPLMLVSMGLLSMIFSSAAIMFFRVLGG